nr:pyruvate kinase [Hyphomicrobium sp.]
MRRNRRVKIVATLGPASAAPEMVERLFLAGVDVFRINMSHSTHDGSKTLYNTVRACAARHRHPIGILADLQGPKFRVGEFQAGRVQVPTKSIFRFDRAEVLGDATRVFLPHTQIFDAIEPGHNLVLDDGKLRMRVIEKSDVQIVTEVITGGMLASRKGISMPDTLLPISPLTEKDKADLSHALKLGVDWVALSFVQRAEDLYEVRKLIGDKAAILSKIEKPSAVTDLEAIIAASDGIMVARGDLGVELPVEKVPGIQKRITRMARAAGKPVIVATQMLESMISSPMPTRAEVSDVATAVFDGADAIMLSAESAVGQYPTEAIQMIDKIAIEVEHDP